MVALLAPLVFIIPLTAGDFSSLEQFSQGVRADLPAVPRPAAAELVFPEDGSRPMKAWYTAFSNGHPSQALRRALAAEGVEPRDIKFSYDWIQDIALFDAAGGLILQADIPGDILAQMGLTTGVLNTEDGAPRLTALSAANAAELNIPYRMMEWTFLEGGALITGTLADGAPYAIITGSTVEGAQLLYERRTGGRITSQEAKKLVAGDLRVSPENLFVVTASGHLDLVITPLPGGVVLLSDPGKTAGAIQGILELKPPATEVKRLESMLELYLKGWQPLYSQGAASNIAGTPMGARQYAYDAHTVKLLDNIEKVLAVRLKVVRVAGVFKEVQAYDNSKDSFYLADRINFFNGFTGSNTAREAFQITNGGRGLSALENYWRAVLAGLGVGRAHFPGAYGNGAGIDCSGAPAGR